MGVGYDLLICIARGIWEREKLPVRSNAAICNEVLDTTVFAGRIQKNMKRHQRSLHSVLSIDSTIYLVP